MLTEFTTFANICTSKRGFKQLVLYENTFGAIDQARNGTTIWRCTQPIINATTKKPGRCKARLRTKIIDGYEMIKNPLEPSHSHPITIHNEKDTKKKFP